MATYDIIDSNSSIKVGVNENYDVYDWKLGETDYLYDQILFYGTYRPGYDRDRISSLPLVDVVRTDTNTPSDSSDDTIFIRYGTSSTFYIDLWYSLKSGDNRGALSVLMQSISVSNNSTDDLSLDIFLAANYELSAVGENSRIIIEDEHIAHQWFPNGMQFVDNVITPKPQHYFASSAEDVHQWAHSSIDASSYAGPYEATEVGFAFGWDMAIPPGNKYVIWHFSRMVPIEIVAPSGLHVLDR